MVEHGGNVYAAARRLGMKPSQIADFSASINPLGVPASVAKAIRDHVELLRHYPDPDTTDLTVELARTIGVEPDMILCGNGSTELIYLIARTLRPSRVLMPAPTFTEYARAVVLYGRMRKGETPAISYLALSERESFGVDADAFIAALAEGADGEPFDLAFLCNPNNPTAGIVDKASVLRIADAARKLGTYLVVDEAFIDFVPDESVASAVASNPSLIVLRSLTKFYALPGLRLGCGVVPLGISGILRRHQEPWSVNSLAQVAGVAALRDHDFYRETFKVVAREKRLLEDGFGLIGLQWYPSLVNFYLLKIDRPAEISERLFSKGILVRECGNFFGLDDRHLRIAVRTRKENLRLLEELANLCKASS